MTDIVVETSSLREADRVLLGDAHVAADPERAYALYSSAADSGCGMAAHRLAVLHALGVGRPACLRQAMEALKQAAHLGHAKSQAELDLIRRIESYPAARMEAANQDPPIVVLNAHAPPEVCRWIIEQGRARLAPGQVNHISSGAPTADPMRTAEAAHFQVLDMDLVLAWTLQKIARTTGLPLHQFEPANLLRYRPGQEYKAHFDFINPAVPAFHDQLAVFGQRIATALIYLNEDYEGGETSFPALGFRFRGKPGDALLFFNVGADGWPHRASLHAGLPPSRGEKWVLSIWIRDRVQPIL